MMNWRKFRKNSLQNKKFLLNYIRITDEFGLNLHSDLNRTFKLKLFFVRGSISYALLCFFLYKFVYNSCYLIMSLKDLSRLPGSIKTAMFLKKAFITKTLMDLKFRNGFKIPLWGKFHDKFGFCFTILR